MWLIMPAPVQLKVWVMERAEREGVTPAAIYQRLSRGTLPYPRVRRLSRWLVLVVGQESFKGVSGSPRARHGAIRARGVESTQTDKSPP